SPRRSTAGSSPGCREGARERAVPRSALLIGAGWRATRRWERSAAFPRARRGSGTSGRNPAPVEADHGRGVTEAKSISRLNGCGGATPVQAIAALLAVEIIPL